MCYKTVIVDELITDKVTIDSETELPLIAENVNTTQSTYHVSTQKQKYRITTQIPTESGIFQSPDIKYNCNIFWW